MLRAAVFVFALAAVSCDGPRDAAPQVAAPQLGKPAPALLVAAWDRDVMPDGSGLPPGAGSVEEGRLLFERQCAACHGAGGVGGPGGDLAGGVGTLAGSTPKPTVGSYWPYATTLFDYVRRAMPYDRPGSLADSEVYALVAYLLAANDIVSPDAILDAEKLPRVAMPNRGGFRPGWPPTAPGTRPSR